MILLWAGYLDKYFLLIYRQFTGSFPGSVRIVVCELRLGGKALGY